MDIKLNAGSTLCLSFRFLYESVASCSATERSAFHSEEDVEAWRVADSGRKYIMLYIMKSYLVLSAPIFVFQSMTEKNYGSSEHSQINYTTQQNIIPQLRQVMNAITLSKEMNPQCNS